MGYYCGRSLTCAGRFVPQIEIQIRNHALESGCFVVNATGWLTDEQVVTITSDDHMRRVLSGGCMTAIIGPDGKHVVPPITEGEGILIADLDFSLIVNRKRMMDSVGPFSRPDLFRLHATTDARADGQRLSLRETSPVDGRTRECDKGAKEQCQHDVS